MRLQSSLCALLLSLSPLVALADPVDLTDATPRWVSVQFEDSPRDRPGQLDTRYTEPVRAWLKPASTPGQVQIALSGDAVERAVLRRMNPKPGTFSSFVWTFDAVTGEVLSGQNRYCTPRPIDM